MLLMMLTFNIYTIMMIFIKSIFLICVSLSKMAHSGYFLLWIHGSEILNPSDMYTHEKHLNREV